MNSKELNIAIAKICDRDDLAIQGGKCIPYVGWFWREVDFDTSGYNFAIIPDEFQGFMENDKWGHDITRRTTPEEWAEIKKLLVAAVENPTRDTTKAVWDYIQTIDK